MVARRPEGDGAVGSVGEEAAKLLAALQGWAKETGGDYAGATGAAAAGAASALHRIDEHVATGGEDCRYCPLCQMIAVVRQTSPEVREHLASAASSLLAAAAGALATPVPDRGPTHGSGNSAGDGRVQKIDLDDSDDEWKDT